MSELDLENHRKSKLPPSALKLPGMDILPMKQRFSLHPGMNKSIDLDAKLLLPSQILNHQSEPPKVAEPLRNETNQVWLKFRSFQFFCNFFFLQRRNFLSRAILYVTWTSLRSASSDGCQFWRSVTVGPFKLTLIIEWFSPTSINCNGRLRLEMSVTTCKLKAERTTNQHKLHQRTENTLACQSSILSFHSLSLTETKKIVISTRF